MDTTIQTRLRALKRKIEPFLNMPKTPKSGDVLFCAECGVPFFFTRKMHKDRKFCSVACYAVSKRKWNEVRYPVIWWTPPDGGKRRREYVHRIIWMEAHPEETLERGDIIHHIDGNPFNRAPDNLERLSGEDARAHHLHKHNFHKKSGTASLVDDPECPF